MKGYEDTSMDDLLEAMQIRRGSFYNAFESKREVYLRALELYMAHITEQGPFAGFFESEPGIDGLHNLLKTFVTDTTHPDGPKGCFFAHACSETRGEDPEVKKIILDGMMNIHEKFTEAVRVAQGKGQIPSQVDPVRAAVLMISVAYGFQVLAAAGVEGQVLAGTADEFFSLFGGQLTGV